MIKDNNSRNPKLVFAVDIRKNGVRRLKNKLRWEGNVKEMRTLYYYLS